MERAWKYAQLMLFVEKEAHTIGQFGYLFNRTCEGLFFELT